MSRVSQSAVANRLAQHRLLASAPRQELEWLAAHGYLVSLRPGEILTSKKGRVDGLYVVLSGHFTIHVDRGAGPKKVMEWRAGDVTGVLPYSRIVGPPADVVAQEPSEAWTLHRAALPALIRECPELTSILVHVMVDRARHFTSSDFQDEKLVSLGKLAAGLAHELNNPASAVTRNAKELEGAVLELDSAAREVGASKLTAPQAALLDEVRARCMDSRLQPALTPLQRGDREESFTEWLERHDVDVALAGPLADSAATAQSLEDLASALSGSGLRSALRWVAAGCQVRQLVSETQTAAARVHSLVAAVKAFTHMGEAMAPSPVDLERSLSDTLAVLAGKARAKSVGLVLDVQPGLPPIRAVGGELNQVWANLIENAIDAVPGGGQVTIRAGRQSDEEVVRIIDNGPGIPPEIQTRIFDPFFTTKPVGHGTGLGLDIVRRLVRRAEGRIEMSSKPGHTEFRVAFEAPSPEPEGARAEKPTGRAPEQT
jgi:signal transduction histidine kinase